MSNKTLSISTQNKLILLGLVVSTVLIVGLAVFAAILAVFAVEMIKLSRLGGRARGLAISLLASITAFCMCGMTDYPFYGLKPMCYMMLIFGLSAAAVKVYFPKQ